MKTNICSRTECYCIDDPFSQIPETWVNISHNNANVSTSINSLDLLKKQLLFKICNC